VVGSRQTSHVGRTLERCQPEGLLFTGRPHRYSIDSACDVVDFSVSSAVGPAPPPRCEGVGG